MPHSKSVHPGRKTQQRCAGGSTPAPPWVPWYLELLREPAGLRLGVERLEVVDVAADVLHRDPRVAAQQPLQQHLVQEGVLLLQG